MRAIVFLAVGKNPDVRIPLSRSIVGTNYSESCVFVDEIKKRFEDYQGKVQTLRYIRYVCIFRKRIHVRDNDYRRQTVTAVKTVRMLHHHREQSENFELGVFKNFRLIRRFQ